MTDEFRLGNTNSNATTLLWGDMANNRLGIGVSSIPAYKLVLGGLANMDFGVEDCDTAGATEAAWIKVVYDLGGTPTTGYIRIYATT